MKEGSKVPRKGFVPKRDVLPDPLYGSKLVTRLINNIMLDGKKGVAQKIVYDAFDIVKEKTGKEPVEAFEQALNNVMPVLEVKARRVGGATYQVPLRCVRTGGKRSDSGGLQIIHAAETKRPCVKDLREKLLTP
jgi:small subunit ribosomal protein S7